MYLSNRDIKWAIECGKLIFDPPPDPVHVGYDETSIDLHLADIKGCARVWDIAKYQQDAVPRGGCGTEISLGDFEWGGDNGLARRYLIPIPEGNGGDLPVFRRGNSVIVKPFGFVLWMTKERVGTPPINVGPSYAGTVQPELICFVNAKSTKARTGLLVHFTAPTIHANWAGQITLEITNLGPFDFVLKEGDAIAQLTVATISSPPDLSLRKSKQLTQGQTDPSGAPPSKPSRKKPKKG